MRVAIEAQMLGRSGSSAPALPRGRIAQACPSSGVVESPAMTCAGADVVTDIFVLRTASLRDEGPNE